MATEADRDFIDDTELAPEERADFGDEEQASWGPGLPLDEELASEGLWAVGVPGEKGHVTLPGREVGAAVVCRLHPMQQPPAPVW